MGYIYCIYNKINNKSYIGKSVDFDARKKEHIRKLKCGKHINNHLQNSWDKYGEENFLFSVLLSDVSDLKLNRYEKLFIQLYNTNDKKFGYNLTIGGDGVSGYTHSEEVLMRLRKNHADFSGEKHPYYNKKHTNEIKKIISDCMKGEGNGMFGKKHTYETKRKISEKMKNVNVNKDRRKYDSLIDEVKIMLNQDISQTEISKLLNIPQPYVSKIKNGKY